VSWQSSLETGDTSAAQATVAPIGFVRITVYALTPGQSQVQIAFPEDALGGTDDALAARQQFVNFATSELSAALSQLDAMS
jgi:hypothetical protein